MSAPKVNVSWSGVLALAAVAVGGYVIYKAIQGITKFHSFTDSAGNAIAGALVPDANAQVQTQTQGFLAAWKAAGKPATGSSAELALRQQFGIAPPPASQIPSTSITGAGSSNG